MSTPAQPLGTVGGGENGAQLPHRSLGAVAAVVGGGGPLAQDGLVGGVFRRTDDPAALHAGLDGLLAAGGHGTQQGGEGLPRRSAHRRVASGRHDRTRGREEFGATDHQGLGDHAAHRRAKHMATPDSELSEQGSGIVGHVLNEIDGRRRVAAQERAEVGQTFELGREPAVTVVEADDEEAALAQPVDELLGPGDQLSPQPHDEEERRIGWIPFREVLDVDPVDVGGGHQRLPSAQLRPVSYQPGETDAHPRSDRAGPQTSSGDGRGEAGDRARGRRAPPRWRPCTG